MVLSIMVDLGSVRARHADTHGNLALELLHPHVVEQAGLIEEHSILVIIEPQGIGIAANNAHLAAVLRIQGVAEDLEDHDAVF